MRQYSDPHRILYSASIGHEPNQTKIIAESGMNILYFLRTIKASCPTAVYYFAQGTGEFILCFVMSFFFYKIL